MKQSRGFTVIEVLVVLAFVLTATILFITQRAEAEAISRDSDRKVSINAMYYNLEEVFYEKNGHYPQDIDSQTLRAMDPELFRDPDGLTVNDPHSSLHYEAANCNLDGKCRQYTLRAELEREEEFVKNSRRN